MIKQSWMVGYGALHVANVEDWKQVMQKIEDKEGLNWWEKVWGGGVGGDAISLIH